MPQAVEFIEASLPGAKAYDWSGAIEVDDDESFEHAFDRVRKEQDPGYQPSIKHEWFYLVPGGQPVPISQNDSIGSLRFPWKNGAQIVLLPVTAINV
ncbi:hypothetical protein I317_00069 [Kwoniella heveanensis CBS 569]|uniref:DM13 domain-containing protein n=1 Tax=Kwoniella heveanensis BCC8398 TaxID=1296120 RepID=A0A1B9H1S9_9TREE|nr:hypothetical protein I316_01114 [Kwoniella heveanensis BCC8398]OCF45981.1 hypothetical protein I317_00069 [Kwoniella heveanensis CBS 569]